MSTVAIETAIELFRRIPDSAQENVIAYLEKYLAEIEEEAKWQNSFDNPSLGLLSLIAEVEKDIESGSNITPYSESALDK